MQREVPAVELRGVGKAFGDDDVLQDVTLDVAPGQILGLMGPSGCGKTTLVRLLVGLSAPTSGEVRVHGVDPLRFGRAEREAIGYMPQQFFLYPTMSVWGNALFVASLYGLGWRHRRRRAREVLRLLELWDARGRLAREISGGMQRRLLLACALLHRPRLLVVDEPTVGLDPVLRAKVWEHLLRLRDEGVTVVLTTQLLTESDYCDRVALLSRGRVVAAGTVPELRRLARQYDTLYVEAEHFERSDMAALWALRSVLRAEWVSARELRLFVEDSAVATADVVEALRARGTRVDAVRSHLPTFDEVFVGLVSE